MAAAVALSPSVHAFGPAKTKSEHSSPDVHMAANVGAPASTSAALPLPARAVSDSDLVVIIPKHAQDSALRAHLDALRCSPHVEVISVPNGGTQLVQSAIRFSHSLPAALPSPFLPSPAFAHPQFAMQPYPMQPAYGPVPSAMASSRFMPVSPYFPGPYHYAVAPLPLEVKSPFEEEAKMSPQSRMRAGDINYLRCRFDRPAVLKSHNTREWFVQRDLNPDRCIARCTVNERTFAYAVLECTWGKTVRFHITMELQRKLHSKAISKIEVFAVPMSLDLSQLEARCKDDVLVYEPAVEVDAKHMTAFATVEYGRIRSPHSHNRSPSAR